MSAAKEGPSQEYDIIAEPSAEAPGETIKFVHAMANWSIVNMHTARILH